LASSSQGAASWLVLIMTAGDCVFMYSAAVIRTSKVRRRDILIAQGGVKSRPVGTASAQPKSIKVQLFCFFKQSFPYLGLKSLAEGDKTQPFYYLRDRNGGQIYEFVKVWLPPQS
jgi:hypothetical protein